MTINDLPAIMGTVLIVAGLVLVAMNTLRTGAGDRGTQAGALVIVVGAVLLGVSIFGHHAK